jgi:hypothetical protein
MRINIDKYCILKIVKQNGDLLNENNTTQIKCSGKNLDIINKNRIYYNNEFDKIIKAISKKNNIECISENFFQAFDGDAKIAHKLWNLRNEVDSKIGILIIPDTLSYFYNITNDKMNENVIVKVFTFRNDIFMSYLGLSYDYNSIFNNNIMRYDEINSFDSIENDSNYNITYPAQIVISFLLFKTYADIEYKLIDGIKQKKSIVNGEKIINGTELPIEYIDSTWFVTLIHTEGFKVSGHFRLQPYGKGLEKRKLIYINEFEKIGYTRKAKIDI